ncbi:MAG: Bug family tripartite tricarboxylate transporter substrate binding protein, partial [Polaromonas sp.]
MNPIPNVFRRHAIRRGAAIAAACLMATAASLTFAQAWPAKPVKVIVNFPPGGAADQIARAVTVPLAEALGQPVIVENRAGANGNIGGEAAARSPADGYTLLMSSGGMVSINPHLYPKMAFDPAKDLVPVAAAARVLVFLEVKPSLPVNNVKEFLAYLKANPGKLS